MRVARHESIQVTCDTTDHAVLARCLEEHADDGHHGQAAVCKLGRQLFGLLSRVRGGQHLEAVVARSSALVIIEAAAELHEAEVRGNLCPACDRHLGDCRKPIRDVGELQAGGRRQEARPRTGNSLNTHRHKLCQAAQLASTGCCALRARQLARDLRGDVASATVPP